MTATLPPALAQRIRSDIQSMAAYAVQDATGLLKLDAMENPHRLPPELQAELGFWQTQLQGANDALPCDYPQGENLLKHAASVSTKCGRLS